jgi:phage terminase small subunit
VSAFDDLPQKQQRFCEEYLIDLNATQAAIRAGYSPKNPNAAGVTAHHLLRNPKIEAAVAELRKEQSERCKLTADQVIRELMKLAFGNLGDYHVPSESGLASLDLSKITNDQWAALKRIKIKQYADGKGEDARDVIETEIEMHDKKGPLIELGKHLGLFRGEGNVSKEVEALKVTADKQQRHVDHLAHFAERYRKALPAPKQPEPAAKAKGKAKAKAKVA